MCQCFDSLGGPDCADERVIDVMRFSSRGEDCDVPQVEAPLGTGPVCESKKDGRGSADEESVKHGGVRRVGKESVQKRGSVFREVLFERNGGCRPLGANESKLNRLVVERDDRLAGPLLEGILQSTSEILSFGCGHPDDDGVVCEGRLRFGDKRELAGSWGTGTRRTDRNSDQNSPNLTEEDGLGRDVEVVSKL